MRKILSVQDHLVIMQDVQTLIMDFMTPARFADLMVRMSRHIARGGGLILEPSAGTGNIVEAIARKGVPRSRIIAVEREPQLCEALKVRLPDDNVICADFIKANQMHDGRPKRGADIVHEVHGKVDTVVMNPPFDGGYAFEHIYAAWELLNDGGSLVSTIPSGINWEYGPNQAFREFLDWRFESNEIHATGTPWYYDDTTGVGVMTELVVAHGRLPYEPPD